MQTSSKEFASVLVLALGFGLVGIDRFLISTMFPTIARDLHLGYADIGKIAGALAIAWGLAALFMGNIADRIGRRKVLVGSLVVFSLLIGLSGLAVGLLSLIGVRILMGLADGAYTPASISATLHSSPPHHRGRNIGFQQMTLTLFGLGLSPLIVAALLHVVPWRWVFSIFVIPGLLLAWFTWRIIPAPDAQEAEHVDGNAWMQVLRYRNVRLLMPSMLCWLTCLITTSAFMPSYLLDHLHLSELQMGSIMSAIGFGSTAGTLLLPWLSDRIGRKPVMMLSAVGTGISLLLLNALGPQAALLFAALFMVHFFNNAAITLTVGPLCSETVPVALMATASGTVIAVGELLGGGLAPILAGHFAEEFGLGYLLWLPIGAIACGFLLSLFLTETLPSRDHSAVNTI